MPGTYEKINYGLRPAKAIERKMLCEVFRRLSPFARVDAYRYIGFGSTYFSDFVLFHKSLGIKNMISIERDEENEARFRFNRPFSCIRIEFGESTEVLPKLSWDTKTIIWLDYDGKLNNGVLADVSFFCASAVSGSMIIVTVNAHPERSDSVNEVLGDASPNAEELAEHRLQQFTDRIGEDKVPEDISGKNLAGWRMAGVCRRIIENEILQTLNERNGGRDPGSKLCYKQLVNFHYADGAKMLTVGGLLYEEGEDHKVAYCSFNNLLFVRSDDEPCSIQVPSLTYKEIRHLDEQLPTEDCARLEASAIPREDLERYAQVYRYFPRFAETEL